MRDTQGESPRVQPGRVVVWCGVGGGSGGGDGGGGVVWRGLVVAVVGSWWWLVFWMGKCFSTFFFRFLYQQNLGDPPGDPPPKSFQNIFKSF